MKCTIVSLVCNDRVLETYIGVVLGEIPEKERFALAERFSAFYGRRMACPNKDAPRREMFFRKVEASSKANEIFEMYGVCGNYLPVQPDRQEGRQAKTNKWRKRMKKWDKIMWDKILEAQKHAIAKVYGKEAASTANYGWGDFSQPGHVDIATKVYGQKTRVISSTADYPSEEISHSWDR